MNEAQRQAWNAAVASGDDTEISRLQDELLTGLIRKEQDEVLWEAELREAGIR